jgi:hypothetical protein
VPYVDDSAINTAETADGTLCTYVQVSRRLG